MIKLIDLVSLALRASDSRWCAEFVLATARCGHEPSLFSSPRAITVGLVSEDSGWVDGMHGVDILAQGVIRVECIDALQIVLVVQVIQILLWQIRALCFHLGHLDR